MYDLIVIGGGPAGLTATVYALRKRLNVLLLTRDLGGKTNYRLQLPFVEHHLVITGEETVSRFANEIQYVEFARVFTRVERVEQIPGGYRVHTQAGASHEARALIIATGALGRLLNVPGEREFMMRGLCYSAVSYAPLFIEREVAVIGDSALALRSTAELARTARRVTLIAPTRGELDSPLGARVLAATNVEVLHGFRVEQFVGDQYARAVVLARDGERREVQADGFFVELELVPQSELVAHLVERDAAGRIRVDSRNRTSAPGIFAAGDVTDVFAEQVLIAVGEGAKAALAAYEYLLTQ
ncbi:MAG: NAD(P)/FAD-dependent oxidoreductase [Armatimonadota bacterium]|nr:NAD(P)/FAD-dependent oxidoreductase [Armatimonadota bacterium]MDR7427891.1 NAD(P)/FAD-dependent oxidoreductase [Armatimonadota bacterium]MDR7463894.1 NAD(P)/FAD-dependent oxidoreductase [Armatimonadota bacterium]MDR7470064.1 NAD(P)/FAD-dependent oxidoreductase [Armatimonadota bacterium]MDR7474414.1 NAD(P)/FAD-dependent oxidoreductase [Armatimonadota bacterium]